jgi:hypothetical protein
VQLTRRRPLVEMLTAEKNRVVLAPGTVPADMQAPITWLEQRLADLEIDIGSAICARPLWWEDDDLLQCTPGGDPCSPGRFWPICRNLAPSAASRLPPWWVWPRRIGIGGRGAANALSGAFGPWCVACRR